MSEIRVTPESFRTSVISPIELSRSEHVQVSFETTQVDIIKDLKKNIKGSLIKRWCKSSFKAKGRVAKKL